MGKYEKVIIYCDGACSGNQFKGNKGGWGALLVAGDVVKEIRGGERNTSNQRMELLACIEALRKLNRDGLDVEVYSDSAYLVNCMNQKWYERWQINGWKNARKQPVENKDLWLKLLDLLRKRKVTFHKVKGHSTSALNELADNLAQRGIKERADSTK